MERFWVVKRYDLVYIWKDNFCCFMEIGIDGMGVYVRRIVKGYCSGVVLS